MHPELVIPFLGAVLAPPLAAFLSWRLVKRWSAVSAPRRIAAASALGVFAAAYCLCVYAWFIEPNRLIVHRETIVSAQWRGAPVKIAAIGDIHIGSPHVNVARVRRLVARVNALRPDLILLLGDYVGDNSPESPLRDEGAVLEGLEALGELEAPLGVFAAIGNHDNWWDGARVRATLKSAGVTTLVNAARGLRNDDPFLIVGLDDDFTGAPNYEAALAQISPDAQDASRIVFMHSPDAFPDVPDEVALTIAAHTHCGQVTIPFLGRPITPSEYGQRFACHKIVEEGRQLFVTGGVGTSVLPVRFLNPPEIALLTIAAPAAD